MILIKVLVFAFCVFLVKTNDTTSFNGLRDFEFIMDVLSLINKIPETECKRDLNKLYQGLALRENWALQMLDSWAKPQSGLMSGNIMHIGNYDECLSINSNDIRRQYCSVIFKATNQNKTQVINQFLKTIEKQIASQMGDLGLTKISFGICIPSSCDIGVLQDISEVITKHFEFGIKTEFRESLCDYEGKNGFSIAAVISSSIFLFIIFIVILATIYDLITLQYQGRSKLLISLSAYTNSKKIFSNHTSANNISCLNGIKFVSIFWIILGHKYMVIIYVPYVNTNALQKWPENPLNMAIVAATFAVDTFLVVSGFLVSYTFFRAQSENVNFNVLRYWTHRVIRLTPSLAALVLFLTTLVGYIGDGPLWDLVMEMTQSDCKNNWWAVLLYVQNYIYPFNGCAPHAWYLAVDMQLYVLAPLLLVPFVKWPKTVISFTLLLTMGSLGWTYRNSWVKDLDLMYYNASMDFLSFYISTHFRASSWLIGLIMGYVTFKTRTRKIKIKTVFNIALWIITLTTMSSVIFGHFSFIANEHDRLRSTIFNTFSRPAWCLAVCWVIFACHKGYGGVVNKFLSMQIFNICGRITYSMYILHEVEILYTVGTGRVPKYFSNEQELRIIWSDLITTMFIGFVWTLLFELPFIGLEKVVLDLFARKNRQMMNQTRQVKESINEVFKYVNERNGII